MDNLARFVFAKAINFYILSKNSFFLLSAGSVVTHRIFSFHCSMWDRSDQDQTQAPALAVQYSTWTTGEISQRLLRHKYFELGW